MPRGDSLAREDSRQPPRKKQRTASSEVGEIGDKHSGTHTPKRKRVQRSTVGSGASTPTKLLSPEPPRLLKQALELATARSAAPNTPKHTTGNGAGEASPVNRAFDFGADFIAFAPDPEPEDADEQGSPLKRRNDAQPPLERSHGRETGRSRPPKRRAPEAQHNTLDETAAGLGDQILPWTIGMDWAGFRNVAELLHQEVIAFSNYLSPTDAEHEVRGMIVALIERSIRRQWPDAAVLPFGSYETKLYHPLGDIDLVIQSRAMDRPNRKNVLYQLASVLKRDGITDHVQVIANARVPIVKFKTTHGRFLVDISINQENGLATLEIINGFLREIPALRPLATVVKAFLRERSMNEVYNGGLGSYSTICLVVSFLQMHPKIRQGEIEATHNLGVLLIEFLELYGHSFNVSEVGVSLRDGGTYFSKADRGWYDSIKPYLLSVEDPQDAGNDVSKGSYQIRQVFRTFAGANEILTATAYKRAAALESHGNGRYTRLKGGDGRNAAVEWSMLATIMTVTNETTNHRCLVAELHTSRVLHQWLGLQPKKPLACRLKSPPAIRRTEAQIRATPNLEYDVSDMEMSDDDENPPKRRATPSDDDTRYGTGRIRRTREIIATVHSFTTDEEDGEDLSVGGDELILHTSGTSDKAPVERPAGAVHIDRKRAYWAAKCA